MNFSACVVISSVIVISFLVQSLNAIECWTCSTDINSKCGDPYNTTFRYEWRNEEGAPEVKDCESVLLVSVGMIPVCLKEVVHVKGRGRQVIRKCSSIPANQFDGTCPSEPLPRTQEVEFCEVCRENECNSAEILTNHKIYATLFSLLTMIFRNLT